MDELSQLLPAIREMHDRIRTGVMQALRTRTADDLSRVVAQEGGDVVFAVDRVGEAELLRFVGEEIAAHAPIVLVAEGIPGGQVVLPEGARETDCRWRMIVDPIDGTRLLMYQKRPGWILTGVAPNRGAETQLADIQLAVQTELPLNKQHLCDQLWAIRGAEVGVERVDVLTGARQPLELRPSQADTLHFGYASISRFFPGGRDVLAAIEDELVRRLLGPRPPGGTQTFEDQYPSTGGQLYSLLSGADRFLADLRPLLSGIVAERGEALGHCCHPYDICTLMIAEQLGVEITDPAGGPLTVPLDVETNVAWVGYANTTLRQQIEPALQQLLAEFGLMQT